MSYRALPRRAIAGLRQRAFQRSSKREYSTDRFSRQSASHDVRRGLYSRLQGELRGKGADPKEVHKVVQELQRRALLRDDRDWVVAISALGRARLWQEALSLLEAASASDSGVKLHPYNAALSACERGHQWHVALALFHNIDNALLTPDIITYNATINALDRGNRWEGALWLLSEASSKHLQLNVISCSAALSACERGRAWEQALEVFHSMHRIGIDGDAVAFNAAISACDRGGRWQEALGLLKEMQLSSLRRSAPSYGAAASACGGALQWQVSLLLLSQLQHDKLSPGLIMMNACINSCRKAEQLHAALHLFNTMRDSHLKPDVLNYTSMITACAPSQEWQLALCLHQDLLSSGLSPDAMAFNAAMGVCREAHRWEEALRILQQLHAANLSPTVPTFKATVGACAYSQRWAEALQQLGALLRLVPWDSASERDLTDLLMQHGIAAKACREVGHEDLAEELLTRAKLHAGARGRSDPMAGLPAEWLSVLHWEAALQDFQLWRKHTSCTMDAEEWRAQCTGLVGVLLDAGREAQALSAISEAQEANKLRSLWADNHEACVLDLHRLGHCSAEIAAAAVRAGILELGHRCGYFAERGPDLIVITGRGNNSVLGAPAVGPAVLSMLCDELGLSAARVPRNPGRVRVPASSLHSLWQGKVEC